MAKPLAKIWVEDEDIQSEIPANLNLNSNSPQRIRERLDQFKSKTNDDNTTKQMNKLSKAQDEARMKILEEMRQKLSPQKSAKKLDFSESQEAESNLEKGFKLLESADQRIQFIKERNPHRNGSNKFQTYENAKESTTVKEAKQAGASLWDIKDWFKKDFVNIILSPTDYNSSEAPSVLTANISSSSNASNSNNKSSFTSTSTQLDSDSIHDNLISPLKNSNSTSFIKKEPISSSNPTSRSVHFSDPEDKQDSTPAFSAKTSAIPIHSPLKNIEVDDSSDPSLKDIMSVLLEHGRKMATKQDMMEAQQEIKREVKVQITEAVDPIKDELAEQRERIKKLELKERNQNSSSQGLSQETFSLLNTVDPAYKQIVFKQFPEDITADARVAFIEELLHSHHIKFLHIDHFFNGSKDNRKLTRASYVEFANPDAAIKALSQLGGAGKKFDISRSSSCVLKRAISALNRKRNWSLREAEKLIKSSALSRGKDVLLDWKSRSIKVNSTTAFNQEQNELKGSFLSPYDDLRLP